MRSVGWSGTRFSMTPSAKISNPHTRRAYARPVERFLAWCEEQGIELRQVTPGLAGRFIQELPGSDPTRNLALAALRHFFDALVTRHAVALNPFSSVRGKKHSVVDGKTPELSPRAGAGIARLPGPLSRGGVAGSGRAGRADLAWSVPGNPVKARQADCHCLLADTELLRKFRDGVLKIPIAFQIKNALEKKLFRH